ncbi:MAG: DUF1266 domain-containing protein [Bacteroidota bacterium]
MNPLYTLPLTLAIIGYLLLVLSYVAIRRRKIQGEAGEIEASQLQYYLRLGGYLLGAALLLVFAGTEFHRAGKWQAVLLYVLSLGLAIWLPLGFRAAMKRLFRWLSKPRRSRKERRKATHVPDQPTPQEWALATVAMLSKVDGRAYFLLGGESPGDRAGKSARKRLNRKWDIREESQFGEEVEWLFEEGHRQEFQEMIRRVGQFQEAELTQYLSEIEAGKYGLNTESAKTDERHRVEMARQNQNGIRYVSFMAWDYLRCIQLIREGFLAGYIEEEEAWNRIFSAAQVLQSRYDSWEEMSRSFLMAREFWSKTEMDRDGNVYRRALAQLLDDEKSPWQQIPWELALSGR